MKGLHYADTDMDKMDISPIQITKTRFTFCIFKETLMFKISTRPGFANIFKLVGNYDSDFVLSDSSSND